MLSRGHVGLDAGRDVLGLGLDAEGEHELLEHAAVTHAFGLADQVDGHLGRDGDVAPYPDEVDVQDVTTGRVPLDLPGERQVLLAVHLEGDQRVGAGLAGQDVGELTTGHREVGGVGLEAVHDRGDLAFTAQPSRRPAPDDRAGLGGKRVVGVVGVVGHEIGPRRRSGTFHCAPRRPVRPSRMRAPLLPEVERPVFPLLSRVTSQGLGP